MSGAITTAGPTPLGTTTGAPAEAMASFSRAQLWAQVCTEIEAWRNNPDWFDEEDRPSQSIMATASLFASHRAYKSPPPSHVAPSGEGRLIFAWQGPTVTFSIELLSPTRAEAILFVGGKVKERGYLQWNADSRDFEQIP